MKLFKRIILLSTLLFTINIKVNASETATVTIGYNDINGHVIKEKKDKCIVGKDYTASAITINGYELTTETPKKQTIYCDSEFANNIAFVYQVKASKKEGTVKAYYVDSKGNKISEPDLRSGTPGVDYYITPKKINGYTLVKTEGANNGKFTEGEIKVKFIYQKDGVEEPKKEETKKDETKKIVTKKQQVKSAKKTTKKVEVKPEVKKEIQEDNQLNNLIMEQIKITFDRDQTKTINNKFYFRVKVYFMSLVNRSLVVVRKVII